MIDVADLSLTAAATLLASGKMSSVELASAVLDRIDETEPAVHAYARVLRDQALDEATKADIARRDGASGALLGVPIAVKDLFFTRDAPTEAGSAVLAGFQSSVDATAVHRLRDAGAVIVGKT